MTTTGRGETVTDDVQRVIDQERALLEPAVRRSREQVELLLHPDFVEYGASGRKWDRVAMLAAIGTELTDGTVPVVSDMTAVRVASTVIHLTYTSTRPGRLVRRSSLWCLADDGRWRLYFHQGTIVPSA